VSLFNKNDTARKIRTIGFEIDYNTDGTIDKNFINSSFKAGVKTHEEIEFHKALLLSLCK
jgi:hypothetical protein